MPADWIEGFDRYANTGSLSFVGRWSTNGESAGYAALIPGRFGGRAIRLNSQGNDRHMTRLVTPSTRVGMQTAFRANFANLPTGPYQLATWRTSSDVIQAGWGVNNFGQVQVFNAAGTIVFTSDGFEVANDGWTFIEQHVEHHPTLGEIRLKINGEQIYYGTGLNTGSAETSRIRFSNVGAVSGVRPLAIDMVYDLDDMATSVEEDATLGESAALIFRPASDVSVQFTRLSGSTNADMIDEEQADADATYNFSNTVGHTDIFELTDLATTPESVKAVFISICARKLDSGTRQLEYFLVIGGVEYTLDTVFLGASYEFYETVVELNPATGLPWEPSEVNALRVGYRVIE